MINDKISKNYIKTTQIKSVEELADLAAKNKLIYVSLWDKNPRCSSWVINMPSMLLVRWIRAKRFWNVEKIKK